MPLAEQARATLKANAEGVLIDRVSTMAFSATLALRAFESTSEPAIPDSGWQAFFMHHAPEHQPITGKKEKREDRSETGRRIR